MRQSVLLILIASLMAAFSALASTDPAPTTASTSTPTTTLMGAGSESGGWVAITHPDVRPPIKGSAEPRPPLEQLYYLPTGSPAGALYGAMQLSEKPHAIAASGSRVILLFPPSKTRDGSTRWKVRALSAFDQPDPLPPVFEPKGRLEILPALETEGDVVGFCGIPGGGVAALIRPVADATGQPIGGHYELKALFGGAWNEVNTPEPIPAASTCRLLAGENGLALLTNSAFNPLPQYDSLWQATWSRPQDHQGEAVNPEWRLESHPKIEIDSSLVITTGGRLLTATSSATDLSAINLRVCLSDSATKLATLHDIPEQFTLTRVGDAAALVYLSDDPKPQIMTAVVHASTGEILHQGPHIKVPPLTSDDLRFLGFVLALVLMTALVFVLRPAAASQTEVKLPPGTAMANPEARLAAGLIDFAIPLVIVVQIWGTGFMDVLLAPILAERADEFWPFAVTSLAFFGHTCFSEWLTRGRTLGKAVCRIRVASVTGEQLTLWQCVCRNTIKLVCPPLLILIFADPRRRHPGDTLAGAVVIARAKGPEPPVNGDSDGGDSGDDGPGRTNEAAVNDG